jgi:hypothetical integral membrane protein (TIGR02206 family)
MAQRFVLFGADHLAALGATALATAGLVGLVRRRPRAATAVRWGLAVLLGVLAASFLVTERSRGVPWSHLAPLHLCDMAIAVGIVAFVTRAPLASEVFYFWAGAGTLLALVTPDVSVGFPHRAFIAYFVSHGAVVTCAAVLVWGLGQAPRPGAVRRVFLVTNLYVVLVAGVNLHFGTNFLYLRAKPRAPSPLDWFGPWPLYLLVAEGVALVLFTLLALPFRRAERRAPPAQF